MGFLFYLAVAVFLIYFLFGLDLVLGNRSIRSLAAMPTALPPNPPKVSLVVAARNEERNIAQAIRSLLRLDYPDYELLVVNDRSEDATGAILARLCAQEPRLRVIEVETLPAGWLGKNHALWVGARAAAGESPTRLRAPRSLRSPRCSRPPARARSTRAASLRWSPRSPAATKRPRAGRTRRRAR